MFPIALTDTEDAIGDVSRYFSAWIQPQVSLLLTCEEVDCLKICGPIICPILLHPLTASHRSTKLGSRTPNFRTVLIRL